MEISVKITKNEIAPPFFHAQILLKNGTEAHFCFLPETQENFMVIYVAAKRRNGD